MNIKVYNKRGKRNYKETRLINELNEALAKRVETDHKIVHTFQPAETFEELQMLHQEYTSSDAEFEEIENDKDEPTKNNNMSTKDEEIEDVDLQDDDIMDDEVEDAFIDPFNRQEPTTYDYTNDGGFSKDGQVKGNTQTDFAEPMSFDEAFELPDENGEEPVENNGGKQANSKEPKQPRQPKGAKQDPFNPAFDDMSGSSQKKSTKKFAKYIVEAVCALAEKGFVWYANKEINDAKLAEYELSGEMNLSILVTLENGQEATVKRFFQQQCGAAEQLSKFEEEEKKDMAEALAVVFMEKGIAPSATQELLIVVGGVLVKKGAILLSLKSQTNSLLNQLRMMNDAYQAPQPQYEPQPQPAQEPQPQQAQQEVVYEEQVVPTTSFVDSGLVADIDMLDIERIVETKE